MKYRPDVDGLRAIAVIAVIGYHAFPEWVRGGFVGVDVFFVISGYLISGIIFAALERGRFSFAEFYGRRIKRIFPALVLVLAACYAAGWFLLFADRFMQLGKHIAGGAGFVSNYVFWNESGYFDAAADTKPLQHLWSLGIEEQFYLTWPLLVYLTWKSRLDLLAVTGLALVLSMYFNLEGIRRDLVGTFYSPFTRFWELMSGGVLAYLAATHGDSGPARRARMWIERVTGNAGRRDACSALGLIVILATVLLLDRSRHFPGLWAALPVGGAFLVILAGPDAALNQRLLSARLIVGIGLISYPLYLWHWPLLSFARLLIGESPSVLIRTAAVLVSVALAWMTYRGLESPIRFGPRRVWVAPALCLAMALVGAAGYLAFQRDGLLARPINRTDKAFFVQYYNGIRKGLDSPYRLECDFMEPGLDSVRDHIAASCTERGAAHTWFLWGDSYAQALSVGITALLPGDTKLAQVATSHCRPSLSPIDLDVPGGRCEKANAFALAKIAELKPDVLILAQLGAHEATDWHALSAHVRSLGVDRVVLVGPVPMWLPSLPEVVTSQYWGKPYDRVGYGLVDDRRTEDSQMSARYGSSGTPKGVPDNGDVTYVPLIPRLCNADDCQATVPGNDPPELIAFDVGHLTPRGSVYIADLILRPVLLGR